MEAVEAVKGDLAAIDSDDDSDEHDSDANDDDDSDVEAEAKANKHSEKDAEREAARATLSAKVEPLERVAQDKKSETKAAAAAAKESRGELDALRAQQKATFCPAETLVKQETIAVDEALSVHKDTVHVSTTLVSFLNCYTPWVMLGFPKPLKLSSQQHCITISILDWEPRTFG